MRSLWMLIVLTPLAFLPACAAYDDMMGGPDQTEATSPTVSYDYIDEDDYNQVAARADAYCEDNYGTDAELMDRNLDEDGYEATFRCE